MCFLEILEKLIKESKAKCNKALRISIHHTKALAGLTKLKAKAADGNSFCPEVMEKSLEIYQESLDRVDLHSKPTEKTSPATLNGSVGFCVIIKMINGGAATLCWQIEPTAEEVGAESLHEVWSSMSFDSARMVG